MSAVERLSMWENRAMHPKSLAKLIGGALLLLAAVAIHLLEAFHGLDYIHHELPGFYLWLVSPTVKTGMVIVTLIFFVIGVMDLRKERLAKDPLKAAPIQPTARQTQETHGAQSPAIAVGSAGVINVLSPIREPLRPPRAEEKKKSPNIQYCGIEAYDVTTSDYWISRHPTRLSASTAFDMGAKAIVLCFKNQPLGTDLNDAEDVQAEIRWLMKNGETYLTVHHGTWLDENYNSTDIPVNSKRGLIILVVYENKTMYAVDDDRESTVRRPPLIYNEVIAENDEYVIEISLVIDNIKDDGIYKFLVKTKPELNLEPLGKIPPTQQRA
jgi:hypothetical protein